MKNYLHFTFRHTEFSVYVPGFIFGVRLVKSAELFESQIAWNKESPDT